MSHPWRLPMALSARGPADFAPFRSAERSGWMRVTCLNPASARPAKLLRPSVWIVEPGATFRVSTGMIVLALKSGITFMRTRPEDVDVVGPHQGGDLGEHPGPVLDRHGDVDVVPGLLDEEAAEGLVGGA